MKDHRSESMLGWHDGGLVPSTYQTINSLAGPALNMRRPATFERPYSSPNPLIHSRTSAAPGSSLVRSQMIRQRRPCVGDHPRRKFATLAIAGNPRTAFRSELHHFSVLGGDGQLVKGMAEATLLVRSARTGALAGPFDGGLNWLHETRDLREPVGKIRPGPGYLSGLCLLIWCRTSTPSEDRGANLEERGRSWDSDAVSVGTPPSTVSELCLMGTSRNAASNIPTVRASHCRMRLVDVLVTTL